MKPKRIFQVYREGAHTQIVSFDGKVGHLDFVKACWRWRLIATRNGQIVSGSQESFDTKGNALRAARREASFYVAGTAAVEVAE